MWNEKKTSSFNHHRHWIRLYLSFAEPVCEWDSNQKNLQYWPPLEVSHSNHNHKSKQNKKNLCRKSLFFLWIFFFWIEFEWDLNNLRIRDCLLFMCYQLRIRQSLDNLSAYAQYNMYKIHTHKIEEMTYYQNSQLMRQHDNKTTLTTYLYIMNAMKFS